jgi:hypothetical protein
MDWIQFLLLLFTGVLFLAPMLVVICRPPRFEGLKQLFGIKPEEEKEA